MPLAGRVAEPPGPHNPTESARSSSGCKHPRSSKSCMLRPDSCTYTHTCTGPYEERRERFLTEPRCDLLVQPIPGRDHRGSSRFPPRARVGCMRDLPRGEFQERTFTSLHFLRAWVRATLDFFFSLLTCGSCENYQSLSRLSSPGPSFAVLCLDGDGLVLRRAHPLFPLRHRPARLQDQGARVDPVRLPDAVDLVSTSRDLESEGRKKH